MTDEQGIAAALVAAGGAIGGAIRWIGGRLMQALDKNSDSMIENTKSNAVLSTKIDAIATYVQRPQPTSTSTTTTCGPAPEALGVEVTTVTTTTKRTPAAGTPVTHIRPPTNGGG